MGMLSIFGKGSLSEKKITKIGKLACNPYAQPDVRMREMGRLLEDGSKPALRAVLKRFATNASGQIADEDEKKYLEDALVEMSEAALEPLEEYIRQESQLTYALRAYKRIAGTERAVAVFVDALMHHGPDDYRALEAKLQLVWQLADDLSHPRVVSALIPFLLDHSDDVRWAVIELLERADDEKLLTEADRQAACEALAEVVTVEQASPRIMRRAAQMLCAKEWPVPTEAEVLAGDLEDEYFLDKKRYVRRRTKRA